MNVRLALPLSLSLLAALTILFAGSVPTPALATNPPRPTPTVAPGGPPVESQGSSAAPDLIVKSIEIRPNPARVNREVRVEVTLANLGGNVPSGNNYFVDLYLDLSTPPENRQPGTHTWSLQSFYIPGGTEYTVSYTTVFTNTGSHTLYAQIDTDGHVVESNEANNIFGPKSFDVTTSQRIRIDTHEEFQDGVSNLDLSSPYGVITRTRNFRQPDDQPDIYHPDYRVNPVTYVPLTGTVAITDRANQVRPKLAVGPGDTIFAVWEDGRNGQVYNRDIYFARSTDRGRTWSDAVRVNQDPPTTTANQAFPVILYDESRDRLYVLWQDNRRGNYDIWLAYSDDQGATWVEPPNLPVNDLDGDPSADQIRPAAVLDEDGTIYVAWQDHRNGNADIYFAFSSDLGLTFSRSVFVTDDPRITEQAQMAPSITVLSDDRVAIVWQDARNVSGGDPSDIWYTIGRPDSDLEPYTFEVDRRVNLDDTSAPQYSPVIAAYPNTQEETYQVEVIGPDSTPVAVTCRVTFAGNVIHFAWEDWRNGNADIFYGWSFPEFVSVVIEAIEIPEGVDPDRAMDECADNEPPPPHEANGEVVENVMLSNRTFEVDDRCLPPDAPPMRNMEPSVQWQPAIAVNSDLGPTIVWSDGRNHDALNYDIYLAMPRRKDLSSLNFADIIYGAVVNDNVHRQAYLDDEAAYQANLPAAAWQEYPSVAATKNGVYVAWDDNRNDDPSLGALNNRDIFMTELITEASPPEDQQATTSGVYISRVFDLGMPVTWYDIEWWGFTDYNANLTLQTRFGNSLDAPEENAAVNGWTQWTGVGGTGGHYDAPGQNIRGPDGSMFPRYRYIQFRVNVNIPAGAGALCVSEITLNYESGVSRVYLPVISKETTAGSIREPNDLYYPEYQWGMRSINAPAAWVRSLGNGQTVAVLDSGIDSGHPEFDGQLVDGYDFVEDDSSYEDDNGHGTHVAGIVAAKSNNGLGIAGVAWNAKIRPVKVLNASGVGSHADVAEAIRWSADQGDRIINLSLGSTANSTTLRDAIDYAYNKGVLIVAAAGNQAQAGNPTIYPAAYDHVLAVGSVTANQQRADYSSYGPYVDLAAPGGSGSGTGLGARIWSTYPRNISNGNSVTGYKDVAGTSQAAPHVSGVAALVLALNPGLGPDQVAAILQESATDLGAPGRDEHFGAGLLNAAGAVNRTVGVMAAASNERPVVPAAAPQPATVDAPFVPGELIVGLSTEVTAAAAQVLADEFNLSIQRAIAPVSYVVTVTPGEEMRLARELAADPRVRYAEPNYLVFSQ